jgi:class 3 adenylate cyclase
VLLADVSGFTRLTEKLVTRYGERRGPEELLERLNRVYDELLRPLHAGGGSVVYFSGDSITCFLAEDVGDKMVRIALQMQSAMRALAASSPDEFDGIGLKVAVGCGEVFRAEVGDPSIQLLEAFAGEVVSEVAAAESRTQLGEVVVTAPLFEALGARLSLRETRSLDSSGSRSDGANIFVIDGIAGGVSRETATEASVVALPDAVADARIHPLVRSRLDGGSAEFIAELRLTSPVFVQFDGLDCGRDASAKQDLSRFVTLVQQIAERYEGAVLSLTMGEKGSYLYLNFGALLLHPDDAVRAIGAALEIVELRNVVPKVTMIRAGVSSGRVRVGAYGGRDRRVYGALGDDVNLAARLMMLSDANQVTVSEAAVLATKDAFEVESRGELPVKGKSSPVPIYRARRKGLSSSIPPSLEVKTNLTVVGRVREKEALEAFAHSASTETSRALLLEGEAGIGKSQLLLHLQRVLRAASVSVLSGAGNSIEKSTPYHVFSRVMAALFKMTGAPKESAERRAYIEAQLPTDPLLRRSAPLLRNVLSVDWGDNEFTAGLEGEVRKTNMEELLLAVFAASGLKFPAS